MTNDIVITKYTPKEYAKEKGVIASFNMTYHGLPILFCKVWIKDDGTRSIMGPSCAMQSGKFFSPVQTPGRKVQDQILAAVDAFVAKT